ncbi:hypothetical protein KGF54_001829 [Candida jiufengensis]|uniref:uncharacterized protein n=1 Tax=Candida jiufengensis TaxID=497108 RepID=UPI002224D74C|nr:uncharacterized protein KGF54_001829 [Candida jiufengensis]KAI5955268.1 hypothetical protein KGF54_001829 [Candida jiufengensis]
MSEYPNLSSYQFQTAIKDISEQELIQKKEQQIKFILKLIETNNELKKELTNKNISNEDSELYNGIIDENKLSLIEQVGRVENMNRELVERGILNETNKEKEEKKLMEDIDRLNKQEEKEVDEQNTQNEKIEDKS